MDMVKQIFKSPLKCSDCILRGGDVTVTISVHRKTEGHLNMLCLFQTNERLHAEEINSTCKIPLVHHAYSKKPGNKASCDANCSAALSRIFKSMTTPAVCQSASVRGSCTRACWKVW